MARFCMRMDHPDGSFRYMFYDTETSSVTDEKGNELEITLPFELPRPVIAARDEGQDWSLPKHTGDFVSKDTPIGKERFSIKTVKLQIGMACNYNCEYCLQKRDNTETLGGVPGDVTPLVSGFSQWLSKTDGRGIVFEIRGGEPLVYWKTLKPLIEQTRTLYPAAMLLITTNGSLLDMEKARWLIKHRVVVHVSHDGPGQAVRGKDPLKEPASRKAILHLLQEHKDSFMFCAMLNRKNQRRQAIVDYFTAETGQKDLAIGEGFFVDIYDQSNFDMVLDGTDAIFYRCMALHDMQHGVIENFPIIQNKLVDFLRSLKEKRPLSETGQKCGLDRPDRIAIDMKGNVLTCQNVPVTGQTQSGLSHKIGHISDFDSIRLNTATHWRHREKCPKCPVVHLCRGGCMYIEGEAFEASCQNTYNDFIVLLIAAFQLIFGETVTYIDHPDLPEDRKDILGFFGGPLPQKVGKKTIRLNQVST